MSPTLPRYLFLFFLFAHTMCVSRSQDTDNSVSIQMIQSNSGSGVHITRVIIQCLSELPGNVTFLRRINDTVMEVSPDAEGRKSIQSTTRHFQFDLTGDLEGWYSCRVDNISSENEVELVAYPFPVAEILSVKQYDTPLGGSIIVNCAYLPGALRKYSVKWYKGLQEVAASQRIQVASNFSLVISNATATDASGYYCEVNLQQEGGIRLQSPTVKLQVLDPIRITQPTSDVAVLPNGRALFTCRASGVPQPKIQWFLSGQEVKDNTIATVQRRPETITVTSALTFNHLLFRQTGPITCVAYHMVNNTVAMATSGANLIVLTSDFSVVLTATNNGTARIYATLPTKIPGPFSLVVQFSFNPGSRAVKEIFHPSLKDTDIISITIPKEKLPSFSTFRVMVAIKANGVQGEFSGETDPIALSNELPVITPEQCNCDTPGLDPSDSGSSGVVTGLLAVFIILMVVFIGVASIMTALCVHYFYKRKTNIEVLSGPSDGHFSRQSSKGFDPYDGSMSRSVSRLSYSSRGSGHSSHSSHSSRSSRSSQSSSKTGCGSPEYDKVDHKQLKQWGGTTGKEIPMCEGGEGKQPKSTHDRLNPAHVSNPAFLRYEKNKTEKGGSSSSFEDLEMESQEFTTSTEIPFRTA